MLGRCRYSFKDENLNEFMKKIQDILNLDPFSWSFGLFRVGCTDRNKSLMGCLKGNFDRPTKDFLTRVHNYYPC